MKFCLIILVALTLSFAKEQNVISLILSQNYSAPVFAENAKDSAFFATQISFAQLVDFEAYETAMGREVLAQIENALRLNQDEENVNLRNYRIAVLQGMAGIIFFNRNSFLRGLGRMQDAQRAWEPLVNTEFDKEANFALGLSEYYRITFLPGGRGRLNAAIDRMRQVIASDSEISLHLSLNYIWILQEQELFEEADRLMERFFARFPDNTKMLRAALAIAQNRENTPEIKRIASRLYEISTSRNPRNYSDILASRRALIFAHNLEGQRDEACHLAREVVAFFSSIPEEERRISWVRRHSDWIRRFANQCGR